MSKPLSPKLRELFITMAILTVAWDVYGFAIHSVLAAVDDLDFVLFRIEPKLIVKERDELKIEAVLPYARAQAVARIALPT